jgi:hypothetical protein
MVRRCSMTRRMIALAHRGRALLDIPETLSKIGMHEILQALA